MRVRVRDISPEGLAIEDTLSLERLNERMDEGRENHTHFTSPPIVKLRVDRSPSGAETTGTVTSEYQQPCARCTKMLRHKCSARADFIFQEKPLETVTRGAHDESDTESNSRDEYIDDVGICYFNGDHIELEELLQESLILKIDPFYQPNLSSSGKCSECGETPKVEILVGQEEVQKGVNFGALLKKAGVQ